MSKGEKECGSYSDPAFLRCSQEVLVWWYVSAIPYTQETEIGRTAVETKS
jgi:hypothetical protein